MCVCLCVLLLLLLLISFFISQYHTDLYYVDPRQISRSLSHSDFINLQQVRIGHELEDSELET